MDNHSMDALSVRGRHQERNTNKGSRGDLNIRVDMNPQEKGQGSTGNVVKLGTIKRIIDLRMLRKKRDLRIPLP